MVWRLASLRIDPDVERAQLYFLMLEGEKDRPLVRDGRVLFFSAPSRARELIAAHASSIPYDNIDVDEPFYACDIADLLYVITSGASDERASVAESTNLLLDIVESLPIELPLHYRNTLYRLVTRFSCEKDVAMPEEEANLKKDDAVNAILWCLGVVTAFASVV